MKKIVFKYKRPDKNCTNCKGSGYTIHECIGYGDDNFSYSYKKRCKCSLKYTKEYKNYIKCKKNKKLMKILDKSFNKKLISKKLYKKNKKIIDKKLKSLNCKKLNKLIFSDLYKNFDSSYPEPK